GRCRRGNDIVIGRGGKGDAVERGCSRGIYFDPPAPRPARGAPPRPPPPALAAWRARYCITPGGRVRLGWGDVRAGGWAGYGWVRDSNARGCSTGRSPGLAPLRMRST